MEPPYTYSATIVRVVDGDSAYAEVSLGFHLKLEISMRLEGINAPELNTAAGKLARDYLKSLIPAGTAVLIRTYKDPKDKYGRWLARIYRDKVDVNKEMLAAGHAVEYNP